MPANIQETVVVTAGADQRSTSVDLGSRILVGLQMPTALTSTTLTFQEFNNVNKWIDVTKVDGNAYVVTVAANKHIVIPATDLQGLSCFRLIMGASEAANRSILVITKPI